MTQIKATVIDLLSDIFRKKSVAIFSMKRQVKNKYKSNS